MANCCTLWERKIGCGGLISAAMLLGATTIQAQVFSLDDNPAAPLVTPLPAGAAPFPPFGFGAEDPFGIVGAPVAGPSPSLLAPTAGATMDGTILQAGAAIPDEPEIHLPMPFDAAFPPGNPHFFINALSNNSTPSPGSPINLLMSVDRLSMGDPGSDVAIEAGFNQQPGDIYVSGSMFADPASLGGVLPPAAGFAPGRLNPPSPGINRLLFDESQFELTAGIPPGPGALMPPGVPAPAIGPGTHDNVDAFELRQLDTNGDFVEDVDYFFSINPDDAVDKFYGSGGAVPYDSADIWFVPAGSGGASMPFALAGALGLAPIAPPVAPPIMGNDIDALVVWDTNFDGLATPGIDFALFSLAPGSVDLTTFGNSPADVFYTDFAGSYGLYAAAADVGLLPTDNIDALEIVISGDANLDGQVNLFDLVLLATNYNTNPVDDLWGHGDFDGNGLVGLSDLVVLAGGFGTATGASLDPLGSSVQAVPEQGCLVLVCMAMAAACWRRCRRLFGPTGLPGAASFAFLIVVAIAASCRTTAQAATLSVTTSDLGSGLYQHRLGVTANDGDVRGFEIFVEDTMGRIYNTPTLGSTVNYADETSMLTAIGENPDEDTHVLYDSTDGINIDPISTSTEFSIATGTAAATPLVQNGNSRELFQLVTQGNVALTAQRLRVNVNGGGGDQVFDGTMLHEMPPAPLDADYSSNLAVDAADYTVWRDTLGSTTDLRADGVSNQLIDGADYTFWKNRFGSTSPAAGASLSAAAGASAVPEPTTIALLMVVMVTAMMLRRRSS